eukprot:2820380-Pyramimonas_sp.AAC.1
MTACLAPATARLSSVTKGVATLPLCCYVSFGGGLGALDEAKTKIKSGEDKSRISEIRRSWKMSRAPRPSQS